MDHENEFRKLIETRFKAEMGYSYPAIPVQWDDVPFDIPDDGMFAAFTYMQNPSKPVTIGRRKVQRTTGYVQIDVSYRKEKNLRVPAKTLAHFAADIFHLGKFKSAHVAVSFSEKHVIDAPAGGEFRRVMARVFFIYDGEVTSPPVKYL